MTAATESAWPRQKADKRCGSAQQHSLWFGPSGSAAPDATLVARYYDIVFNAYEQLAGYQVEVPSDPTYSGAVRYTYDAFGQLSREESDIPAGRDHLNYEYDAAGNLRVWARDGDYVGPFWYNERDQLLSSWTHRHLLKYYSWRADGTPEAYQTANLLQAPEVLFDREQRLLSGIGPAEHRYRADGLRAAKVLPDQVTWYLYDGANLVCEMHGGGAVKTAQTWGPDGLVSRGGAAVAAWQRVVALAPSDAEAWLWLGEALSVKGDHGSAREAWRQAVATGTALTEFSEPIRWARGYLGQGEPVG